MSLSFFVFNSLSQASSILKGGSHPQQFYRTMKSLHNLKSLTSTKVKKLPPSPSSHSVETLLHHPKQIMLSPLSYSTATIPTLRKPQRHVSPTQQPSIDELREELLSKSDLVKALHTLNPTRRPHHLSLRNVSRESILEQALAEQNVIMDTQQQVMNGLQQEIESHIQTIRSQSETIQAVSVWEPRAHAAHKKANELLSSSQLMEQKLLAMTQSLSEKEDTIDSLLAKLESTPSSKTATLDSQLQAKRLKVMELEEKVYKSKEKLSITSQQLSDKTATVEFQAFQNKQLKESILSLQQINDKQKKQITALHSAIIDKESTLAELNESLRSAEQHTSEMKKELELFKTQHSHDLFSKLQEQVVFPVVVHREFKEAPLGFKYTSLPASVNNPRVVVTSSNLPLIEANDEILEVNGQLCSLSSEKTKAISYLKEATGSINVVVARESMPANQLILQLKQANDIVSELRSKLESNEKTFGEPKKAISAGGVDSAVLKASNAQEGSLLYDTQSATESCLMEEGELSIEQATTMEKAFKPSSKGHISKQTKEVGALQQLLQEAKEREKKALAETDELRQQMDIQLSDVLARHKKHLAEASRSYQEMFEKEKEQLLSEHLNMSNKSASQIRNLTTENASLHSKVDELEKEAHDLSVELTAAQQLALKSSQENADYKQELLETQQRIGSLNKTESVLREQLKDSDAELTKLRNASEETSASLITQNQLLKEELTRMQVTMSEGLDSVEKNMEECELQREELLRSESTRSLLQQKLESLQEHNEKLLRQATNYQKEISTLTDSLNLLEVDKTKSEGKLEAKHKECESLLHELEDIRKLLYSSEESSSKLRNDLQISLEDNEKLKTKSQQQIEKLLAEQMTTSQKILRLSDELKAMEEICEIHMKSMEETNSRWLKTQEQLQQKEEELAILVHEKESQQKTFEELKVQLESLQNEATQHRAINDGLKQAKATVVSSNTQLMAKITSAERRVEELTGELQTLQLTLALNKETLKNTEAACGAKVQSIQLEMNNVLSRLTESLVERRKLEKQLEEKEDSVNILTQAETKLQAECEDLQHLLVATETRAATIAEKHDELEKAYSELTITKQLLSESELELKTSLSTVEAEKKTLQSHQATLNLQLEEAKAKYHLSQEKIMKLQQMCDEANSTVKQLQAAQKALQASITCLGDEKDQEILRLREETATITAKLANANKALGDEVMKALQVEKQLETSQSAKVTAENACSLLQAENSAIKEELSAAQSTASQMVGLKERISSLESSLLTKNDRLSELEEQARANVTTLETALSENQELTTQLSDLVNLKVHLAEKQTEFDQLYQEHTSAKESLQKMQIELEELDKEVAELAIVKLNLVEKESELQKVEHALSEETKKVAHFTEERDQLMSVLRKLELEKHRASIQKLPQQAVKSGSSKQDLAKALKEQREENWRLNEYIEKLLKDILEKAPHILENK